MAAHLPLFIISKNDLEGEKIILKDKDFKHLIKVLRKKVGDFVDCKLLGFRSYHCKLSQITKDSVFLDILSFEDIQVISKPVIGLLLALPKNQVLSSLVPKCTELGLSFIQPVITDYSSIKQKSALNVDRYKRMILESAKQCHRQDLMTFLSPIKFSDLSKFLDQEKYRDYSFLFPNEREQSHSLDPLVYQNKNIIFFIGPEGGFSDNESLALINDFHFDSVSLTETILKVETAVLYTLSKITNI